MFQVIYELCLKRKHMAESLKCCYLKWAMNGT